MVESLHRDIFRLAIPSILANITIPLVGMVDTAIAGHIADAAAIGGIAIASVLFDLLYWSFGFLRVGTSGLAAQAFGRAENTNPILFRAIRIALLGALGILLFQFPIFRLIPALFPCSAAVADFAGTYFLIRVWAAPATLTLMATKGWFIGNQDTVSPMATDILVNTVNIIASFLFAVPWGLGAVGVAWGTVVAQYSGLILTLVILRYRYGIADMIRSLRHAGSSDRSSSFFRLNANLFIRSLCFIVIYVGFTWLAGRYGETELAVSAILMHLFMFFSYFVDGFAYAGEALVGRAIGRAQISSSGSVDRVVRVLLFHSILVGTLFSVIYFFEGMDLCALFTSSDDVLRLADHYQFWLMLFPLVSSFAFMWDGVYAGATAGADIRNAMLWAVVAFVGTYVICMPWSGGADALYAAYMAHLLVRTLYLSMRFSTLPTC